MLLNYRLKLNVIKLSIYVLDIGHIINLFYFRPL